MAGLAVDRRYFVGVRIAFDVGVAVGALQAAVNALAEFLAVNGDAVAGTVGHGGIAVAGKAVSLRAKSDGRECDGENGNAGCNDSVTKAVPQLLLQFPASVQGGFFLRKNPLGDSGFGTQ